MILNLPWPQSVNISNMATLVSLLNSRTQHEWFRLWDLSVNQDHMVKNVLLVNALLTIFLLSDTCGGRVHDKRIVDATPYPLPAGSRLLQALGSNMATTSFPLVRS